MPYWKRSFGRTSTDGKLNLTKCVECKDLIGIQQFSKF